MFPVPSEAQVWGAVPAQRRARRTGPIIHALDSRGRRAAVSFPIPDEIGGAFPWRRLLSLTVALVENWRVRVFLVDPGVDVTRDRSLRFLQAIGRQIGPAVVNIYLIRRLRAKVEEAERARVARELHDGVIQSLLGLEVEIQVARRKAEQNPAEVPPLLEHLQSLLRAQIVEVRKLMGQMRRKRFDASMLSSRLTALVADFGTTSGIDASYQSDGGKPDLAPWICQELVRIVEEALVNVRRHSGAAKVAVTFGAAGAGWTLVVDDNGRGFDFAGRLSQTQLEERGAGPFVILERVEAIGGRLWIESVPGERARLEILIEGSRSG